MKKTIKAVATMLAATMALSMAACGKDSKETEKKWTAPSGTGETTVATTAEETTTAAETSEAADGSGVGNYLVDRFSAKPRTQTETQIPAPSS